MKKLLVALLATAGITSAFAQSSVSVYGIIDAGYLGTNYTGVGTSSTAKQTTSGFGQSAESASRLGFKGTEDLGNGTSAFFLFETMLTPQNQNVSTWNNRQSFVGLKKNGIGEAALGTQYTGIHMAVAKTDPGALNNLVGDVITATSPQVYGNTGSTPYADSTGAGTSAAYTTRTSNTLTARSETFKGFSGNGFIALNNQNNTQTSSTTGGDNNHSGWGLGGDYTWNKLFVVAQYQALKSNQLGTLTTPQPALWNPASGGTNTQDNQKYVAATYDFGILKAYAQWVNRKATSTINTNYNTDRTAQQVGVRGNITSNIDAWASVGNGRSSLFGASQPSANFVGYQLGSNYYLSKRTNLYAIYGQQHTSSVSASAGALSASNYAVGVRHTF